MYSRRVVQIALAVALAAAASGCSSLREAAGTTKDSPDEFAVVTKAPLSIPPDFNLRPPAPGAAPSNQIEPTNAAQSALFNADPATVAASMPPTMSMGERYLLASAGVQNADPAIRQQLASDIRGMRGADDSFASSVLFWNAPSTADSSTPVDADAEARRIDAARGGAAAPAGTAPASAPPAPAPAPSQSGDDDSWLDHVWPF